MLKIKSWWSSEEPMGCQVLKPGWLQARFVHSPFTSQTLQRRHFFEVRSADVSPGWSIKMTPHHCRDIGEGGSPQQWSALRNAHLPGLFLINLFNTPSCLPWPLRPHHTSSWNSVRKNLRWKGNSMPFWPSKITKEKSEWTNQLQVVLSLIDGP